MTPTEYRDACNQLGISIYTSSTVLCIGLQTAYRYSRGEKPIPEKIAKLLRALVTLGTTEV